MELIDAKTIDENYLEVFPIYRLFFYQAPACWKYNHLVHMFKLGAGFRCLNFSGNAHTSYLLNGKLCMVMQQKPLLGSLAGI